MRAGRALALKYTKADGLRSGFFQSFDLAKAYKRGEFVAFADYTLSSGRPAGHSSADDVMCKFLQISFDLWFESCFRHKSKSFHHGDTETLRKTKLISTGLIRAFLRNSVLVVRTFSMCEPVRFRTGFAEVPNVNHISCAGVPIQILHEILKVIEHVTFGAARSTVEPMLHNDRCFVFKYFSDFCKIIGRRNLRTVCCPLICFAKIADLHCSSPCLRV